ncbi:SDR family oxidoreductase [Alkalihalobacillus oceani]|uniref:SDR family NAD(P)-dependent oxidoreductase n=1 Tax=Halalkalibacter oceani TaxID=1653776 RepID=UPI00203FFF9B|nr:glucose 1-dehydrogenase [Halalkalibacter oceani]MCM3763241.1 SDR family oxidoreductase [Halalkalibacter oceani]
MRDLFSIENKVAVVTGAARGLGFVYAKALLEKGAKVVICDLNKENVDQAVSNLQKISTQVYGYQVNVSSEKEIQDLVKEVESNIGEVDILVNNAGVVQRMETTEMDVREWDRIMDVNAKGTFLCCRYFGVHMKKRKRGKIVNIASIAGRKGLDLRLAYCTSKASVEHLTRTLAMEWGPDGVNVNAIGPGYIKTKMNEDTRSDKKRYTQMINDVPMGRFGEPEELIGSLLFLVSSASDYITGHTIFVDGGLLTK